MKLNELKEGMNLQKFECYVKSITERKTKKGAAYIILTLADSGGEISANLWDTSKEAYKHQVNDVISFSGTINAYNSKLQLNITESEPSRTDINIFFRSSDRSIDDMFGCLVDSYIGKIKDPFIKFLAEELILSKEFIDKYQAAPAAIGVHHNWIGGLLEHSLGMCKMANAVVAVHYINYFPTINMDKVFFGCIFHDWGKILEYGYNTPNIQYTKRGCLQHHMGIVSEALVRKAVDYEIVIKKEYSGEEALIETQRVRELLHELLHIILSHHGNQEWGSPVRPATAEALLVHLIDYIDGNMIHMHELIKDRVAGDIPGMSKRSWVHQSQYLFQPEEEGF